MENEQTQLKQLEGFAYQLFSLAGFAVKEVTLRQETPAMLTVDVFLQEAGLVIGLGGENLLAWQEVFEKKASLLFQTRTRVKLDINNYRFQHEEQLRELAHVSARKAVLTKQAVKLEPMNAFERKVIHAELSLRPDVHTESEGEEPQRYIVVKPL